MEWVSSHKDPMITLEYKNTLPQSLDPDSAFRDSFIPLQVSGPPFSKHTSLPGTRPDNVEKNLHLLHFLQRSMHCSGLSIR